MLKEKYIHNVKQTALNITQTQIDSIREKKIEKTGLRIYKDGFMGYSGAIGKFDEGELEERALKSLENKIPYSAEPVSGLQIAEDYSGQIIPEDEFIEESEALLSIIRKEQPDFYFSNKIILEEETVKLINDNGLELCHRETTLGISLVFKEKTSVNIMDGFVGYGGRKYSRKEVIKHINQVCNAFQNKVELPQEGKLPVVFTTTDSLPYRKFWQALNGRNFGSKTSLFSDKLGEKIFSDNFTLYQTNNPDDIYQAAKGMNTPAHFFDAEGIVNQDYRYALIENGKLITPYTDKRTAAEYDLPQTGAAYAEYDDIPSLGNPALLIEESDKTAKELLNGQMGILIMIASGGDFTPEGNFATPVQLAFLFDGEKIIGRLPELNLSSNIFDMYGDSFLGVSKDTVNPVSSDHYLIMNMDVSKL